MRDRLLKFMEAEHLQASRLAEILGVQPATISHILNGRNRPSFEFIEKLLQRFPKMNPDWLILGKGNLYRSELQNPRVARERETTPFSPAQMSLRLQRVPLQLHLLRIFLLRPRRIFRINPRIQQTNIRLLDKIALQTQKIFLQKRKLNAPILSALCPSFPHKFRIRTSNGLSYSLKTGHVSPTTPVKITIIMLNTLLGKPQVTKCRLSIRMLPKYRF